MQYLAAGFAIWVFSLRNAAKITAAAEIMKRDEKRKRRFMLDLRVCCIKYSYFFALKLVAIAQYD
jgi:hypothetical protein